MMGWLEFILGISTLVLGCGWMFTYRAFKRKANGEATAVEADAWKCLQDVYQQTIQDQQTYYNEMKEYCEDIKKDRNHLREDRDMLRSENSEMREKYIAMENQILELKNGLAQCGRKLEGLLPLTCSVLGCPNRAKVTVYNTVKDDNLEKEENGKS